MLRTADLIILRPPDANWLINVMGILDPAHEIFERDYMPPEVIVNRIVQVPQFTNEDNFFSDLP